MAKSAGLGECSYPGCTRKAVLSVNGEPACAIEAHIDHVMTPVFAPVRELLRGLQPQS